jgi:DNA (cytosine-5)-methyltransferase 1
MLRAIREIKPSWVVGENVYGLVNWSGGLVFHEVQADLEAEGYEVFPVLLPAVSVNAPHRRDRIWFVAYCNRNGLNQQWGYDGSGKNDEGSKTSVKWSTNTKDIDSRNTSTNFIGGQGVDGASCTKENGEEEQSTNSTRVCDLDKTNVQPKGIIEINGNKIDNSCSLVQNGQERFQLSEHKGVGENKNNLGSTRMVGQENDGDKINRMGGDVTNPTNIRHEYALENGELEGRRFGQSYKRYAWDSFPSVSPICNGDDGLSNRLDSITFPKWRNESIKAGGNAIVPQVVYQIFKAIKEYEALK